MRNSRSSKGKFQVLCGYEAGSCIKMRNSRSSKGKFPVLSDSEFGSLGWCPFCIMGKCFEFRLLCPVRFTAQALPYT
jgi:hypothetical protein